VTLFILPNKEKELAGLKAPGADSHRASITTSNTNKLIAKK
jgi:hypothetical protein